MDNPRKLDVCIAIELSEENLSAVSAGKSDTIQLMQAIQDAMKKISDAANNAIANIR